MEEKKKMKVRVSFIRMSYSESSEPVEIEVGEWFQGNGYQFTIHDKGFHDEPEFGMSGKPTGRYRIVANKI